MKKIFYIIILCTIAIATGCTQEMDMPSGSAEQVMLTLTTDVQYANEAQPMDNKTNSSSQTRATTIARYIMEVYTDEACTVPANVFGATNRKEQASAEFMLTLHKDQTYHCLLWADMGDGAYNANALQTVILADGKQPTEAYCAKAVLSAQPAQAIALKHAVALITLKDKNGVEAGKILNLKYSQYTQFNVADNTVSVPKDVDSNITTTQTAANEVIATFYMLAPQVKTTFEFTFNYNNEGAKTLDILPLQKNYNTHVAGTYAKVP